MHLLGNSGGQRVNCVIVCGLLSEVVDTPAAREVGRELGGGEGGG